MKKCPFCKTELSDEAKFCHYCMSSLDKKNKSKSISKGKSNFPLIIALISVFIALLVIFIGVLSFNDGSESEQNITQTDEKPANSELRDDGSVMGNSKEPLFDSEGGENSETVDNSASTNSSQNEGGAAEEPLRDELSFGVSSDQGSNDDGSGYPEVIYTYRKAQRSDDFYSLYQPYDNEIVITGVEKPSPNGIYYIPDYIGDKKVLAIAKHTFLDDNIYAGVKKVIIGAKVRNIHEDAFAACMNLSDIYFMGESIYTDGAAFSRTTDTTLTIHCSETCDDRNFRLYKNNAFVYNAVYEEWKGDKVLP